MKKKRWFTFVNWRLGPLLDSCPPHSHHLQHSVRFFVLVFLFYFVDGVLLLLLSQLNNSAMTCWNGEVETLFSTHYSPPSCGVSPVPSSNSCNLKKGKKRWNSCCCCYWMTIWIGRGIQFQSPCLHTHTHTRSLGRSLLYSNSRQKVEIEKERENTRGCIIGVVVVVVVGC